MKYKKNPISSCTSVILIKISPTRDVSLQKSTQINKLSNIYKKQVFWNVDRIYET